MSSEYGSTMTTPPIEVPKSAVNQVKLPIPLRDQIITREDAARICHTQMDFLRGKILTIAEAAFGDKEQRRAVKDLIHTAFNEQIKHTNDVLTGDTATHIS